MAKRKLEYTVDSALALMQEIYNELCENRSIAITIQRKMMTFMKEAGDMEKLGPVIKDQQKIINDTAEKKIQISKLQTQVLMKNNEAKGGGKLTISASERELLESLINKEENE